MRLSELLTTTVAIAHKAGEAILDIYNRAEGFKVDIKSDASPLTEADLAAHHVLVEGLEGLLDGVPVLSEESEMPDYEVRRQWSRYWIVDPLDGTKEFVKRSGEFTVNIALIEQGVPVLGVVYVPVSGVTYMGLQGEGAFKECKGQRTSISTRQVQPRIDQDLTIDLVGSRSHGAQAVVDLLDRIAQQLGRVETKSMGSSLKLCLVAEGEADLYPRLALTAEWDTAAAQAVVEAAGGCVIDTDFKEMRYNTKEDILNPYFYVLGDPDFNWQQVLT